MMSSPGLSLQTLLRQAKAGKLKQLIGPSIIDVLEGLQPELAQGERLGDLAAKLIEPSEALRDVGLRDQIIGLLPLPKARELAERLGVEDGRNLFRDLRQAASDKTALTVLFSFFGVVEEAYAPEDVQTSTKQLSPEYGLFHHQRIAAGKVIRALDRLPRKVVLHMPIGSGKTRTAMHIVASHLRTHEPTVVCWLAQNPELLEQAASEFENAWRHLGNRELNLIRFWGDRRIDPLSATDGLIVGGLGKMAAFEKRDPAAIRRFADRTTLVVMDEAHQAIAPTYCDILSALYTKRPHNALLGLTATPGRPWSDVTEDQRLSDFFDGQKVIIEVDGYDDPMQFLTEEGHLARPEFQTLNSHAGLEISSDDIDKLSKSIDVPGRLLERLGTDVQRNLKIVACIEDLASRHSRIIVFAPSVSNARLLAVLLTARGHMSDVVTNETDSSRRERIVRRFRSDNLRTMILCNFGVFTVGFDSPNISSALIARPTRSLVLYSQMVGRATRWPRSGGNAKAEIVTVIDPHLPGFGSIAEAFRNWEDVWDEPK